MILSLKSLYVCLTYADAWSVAKAHKDSTLAVHFGRIGLREAFGLVFVRIGEVLLVHHKAIMGNHYGGAGIHNKFLAILVRQLHRLRAQSIGHECGREESYCL